jgi:hypothetical protein
MIQWTEDGGEIPFSAGGSESSSRMTSSHGLFIYESSLTQDLSDVSGGGAETIEQFSQRENGFTGSTNDHDYDATATTSAQSSKSSVETGSWSFSVDGAGGGQEHGESSSSYSSQRLETTSKITESNVASGVTRSTVWQTLSFEQTVELAWSSSVSNDVGGTPYTHSSLVTQSSTTSGSTTGSTTYSVDAGAGGGTPLQTTTTVACTHSGSTTQTTTFERTQISHSDGEPATVTVTVTDLTTLATSYTVEAVGLTTMAGDIPAGHWERTIVQADCGRHLFAAKQRTDSVVGPAHSFYSIEGTRITLSPDFYSSTVFSNVETDGETLASTSSTSSRSSAADGSTVGESTSEWRSNGTESSIQRNHSALVVDYQTGLAVSDPYAPTWFYDYPASGEAGELTLNLVGPATLSLTLVPGGTEASSTMTFAAAAGDTATTAFPPGIAVFASGCLAASDEFAVNNIHPYRVIEVACFEGWLPRCS